MRTEQNKLIIVNMYFEYIDKFKLENNWELFYDPLTAVWTVQGHGLEFIKDETFVLHNL